MDKHGLSQRLEQMFEDIRDDGRALTDADLVDEIVDTIAKFDMEKAWELEDEDDLDEG